jgi:hypothetical protein
MARTKSKKFLSYAEAQEYVLRHAPHVRTRAQYIRWHKQLDREFLPSRPHRVYDNFSWNDFLNTNNSFEKTAARNANRAPRKFRDYWDAVRYAQAQSKAFNLSTREDWMRFYEEYEVPKDIPKRPWQEYDDFDIKVWLGLGAVAHLKTAREGNVAVVALHNVAGEADNVVELRVWRDGYHAMKAAMVDDGGMNVGRVLRLWHYDDSGMKVALDRMERHGHKRERGYVVPNMHALMWDLMDCMDIFNPNSSA